jgi:HEAT repeat protein
MMAATLKFLGPLHHNAGFVTCSKACQERPELEVLPYVTDWARDADPVKRLAAAYLLWRHLPSVGDVVHSPETTEVMLQLLDDADPRVAARVIGILSWIDQPVYWEAIRTRRTRFESHPDWEVRAEFLDFCGSMQAHCDKHARAAFRDFPRPAGDEGEVNEAKLRKKMRKTDVAGLLDLLHQKTRYNDFNAVELITEAIANRPERDVVVAAAAWARDPDPEKRVIAAQFIEHMEAGPVLLNLIGLLAADTDHRVVRAALASFRKRIGGRYQPHEIALVQACDSHPEAEVRKAFVELFENPGSDSDDAILIRMACDPAREVRAEVVSRLGQRIKAGDTINGHVREALAAKLDDPEVYVRARAITSLSSIDDPRALDAIVAELERPGDALQPHLAHLTMWVKQRPDARYLPGLKRWKLRLNDDTLDGAIKACMSCRRIPWGQ